MNLYISLAPVTFANYFIKSYGMRRLLKYPLLLSFGLLPWGYAVLAMSSPIQEKDVYSFSVYTLSRGSGVPESAREVLEKSTELVEIFQKQGNDIKFTKQRIGLEGETHLCVESNNPGLSSTVLKKVRKLAQGVELVNVIAESCKPYQFP